MKRKATNDAAPSPPALKSEATSDRFDEEEYATLRRHYFDPVVVENVQLGGGRVLRRQTRPPRIECASPGFRALRGEICALEKAGEHARIWHLLRQLRAWEERPPSLGGALPPCLRGTSDDDGAQEVIDVSDEHQIIDVDSFITDVLLVDVRAVKPDPDAPTSGEAASSRTVRRLAPVPFAALGVHVKDEPVEGDGAVSCEFERFFEKCE